MTVYLSKEKNSETLTKHELREALFKLGLYLNKSGDDFFISKSVTDIYAKIDNQSSTYELYSKPETYEKDTYQQIEQLLSDYCHTDPLVRDVEKEFVLRANELPCFRFDGGYEYLGISPFNDEKYTHVQMDKAKVFTYTELKDILEKHNVNYEELLEKYHLIFI